MVKPDQRTTDPDPTRTDLNRARVTSVINGKGGVLKTSLTANLGGEMARRGFTVLIIDLDISGNLKLDIGMRDPERDDPGRSIVDAIWSDKPLEPVRDAGGRPGLHFIFGGRVLDMVGYLATSSNGDLLPSGSAAEQFAKALGDLCAREEYDFVLIDCPPGNGELQEVALMASLDGLRGVGPRVRKTRDLNPGLSYLGVVIPSHNRAASRILREVQGRLGEVGDTLALFTSTIRHSQAAAHDCRTRGQLAYELAKDATSQREQRFAALKARRRRSDSDATVIPLPAAITATADDLAGDYEALVDEILTRVAADENAAAGRAPDDHAPTSAVTVPRPRPPPALPAHPTSRSPQRCSGRSGSVAARRG